jgi:divalent metal cation (Fe/Co/Zn/Cd) transporter
VTVHLGPDQIFVGLSVDFRDEISGHDIELAVERMEKRICEKLPEISSVFVKPQKRREWQRHGAALDG